MTGLFLTQCSNANEDDRTPAPSTTVVTEEVAEDQPDEVWTRERETAVSELKGLRKDVEERILDVNGRLQRNDLSSATRKAVEEERESLLDLRKRIDRSIEDVEGADQSTWQNIKEGVNNTTRDVRDWFKKMGEKVDKETKADADDDGH